MVIDRDPSGVDIVNVPVRGVGCWLGLTTNRNPETLGSNAWIHDGPVIASCGTPVGCPTMLIQRQCGAAVNDRLGYSSDQSVAPDNPSSHVPIGTPYPGWLAKPVTESVVVATMSFNPMNGCIQIAAPA
jgi:hypothetical protein